MNLVRRVQHLEIVSAGTLRVPPPVPFDTPADVLAVLAEQANAVRADPQVDTAERARTLALLAGLALRAMDARNVAARLGAVERVLKLRQDREREGHHGASKPGHRR